MMKHGVLALWFGSALHCVLAQTYVVDAQNGPGAQFTTLSAAVAAVPDGATLIVRSGTYDIFSASRGVTILGEPGARLQLTGLPVSIGGLAAHQRFVMRGIELLPPPQGGFLFNLGYSAGAILLDFPPAPPVTGDVRIQWCEQVQIAGLSIHNALFGAMTSQYSAVSLRGCDLRCDSPHVAILQTNGWLQLTDCYVSGGGGIYPVWNSANIIGVIQNGRVEVRGCTLAAPPGFPPVYAISGAGTVFVDNNTVFTNVAQLSSLAVGNLQFMIPTWSDMAKCTASTGPLGTAATATLQGPAGSVAVLLAGFPARPTWLTGVEYPFWIGVGTEVTIGIGSGSVTGGYSVPNAGYLLGLGITWQGLSYDAANGLQFSNASSYVHHQ